MITAACHAGEIIGNGRTCILKRTYSTSKSGAGRFCQFSGVILKNCKNSKYSSTKEAHNILLSQNLHRSVLIVLFIYALNEKALKNRINLLFLLKTSSKWHEL
jgi:hypothetical protein